MKCLLHLLLMVSLILLSCNQEAIEPMSSCASSLESFPDHPQEDAYQSLLDYYTSIGIPGISVAIYTPEDGLWLGASGHAVIETQEAMEPCHVFFSASLAKTYHVVAALGLVEDGLLDLETAIDQYLTASHASKIPNSASITVKQLMNHTSGIPDFIEEMDHITDYFQDLKRQFTQDEYLDYIADEEPLFAPGTDVRYSNTNTVVLALIMDQVYGSHAKAISDKIIEPLGLSRTFYKNESAYLNPPGLTNCYIDLYGNRQLQNSTDWEQNFSQMSIGHDGMLVNPNDNFLFLKALFEGEILSQATVDLMLDEVFVYPFFPRLGEGLGLELTFFEEGISQRIGHNGGSLGGAHEMRYYPEENVYICTSANLAGFIDSPIVDLYYPTFQGIGIGNTFYSDLEKIVFGL